MPRIQDYVFYSHLNPTIDQHGCRVPDFLPRSEPFKNLYTPWLPTFQNLKNYAELRAEDYRNFDWFEHLTSNSKPFVKPRVAVAETEPLPYHFARHFAQGGRYHKFGKFWDFTDVAPKYSDFSSKQFFLEREEYLRWSDTHLGYKIKPFEIIYDGNLQHPTSHFAYSAIRVNSEMPRIKRNIDYCTNWDSKVISLAYMVDFAMLKRHNLIIVEPTCVADLLMRRVMFGRSLNTACICLSLISIYSASYRSRWPSLFLFPCIIAKYCSYIYSWEYMKDPCNKYGFWTTWTNDPSEQNCFEQVKVNPDLLREEKMTFLTREDHNGRKRGIHFVSNFAIFMSMRALFQRIKYKNAAADMAWEILKRKICDQSGGGMPYIVGGRGSRCSYKADVGFVGKLFFWLAIAGVYLFLVPPLIKRIRRRYDEKTRSRYMINYIAFRAMKGERRYMRIVQPLYWVFRFKFPRDEMGARDRWYLSQRYRHTPGSHQFYF